MMQSVDWASSMWFPHKMSGDVTKKKYDRVMGIAKKNTEKIKDNHKR